MAELLTRYWITFNYPPLEAKGIVIGTWHRPIGFGVTATDFDDAMSILRREWFDPHELDLPAIENVVENVDVSELPDVARQLMNPPNWRGLWFPKTKPLS